MGMFNYDHLRGLFVLIAFLILIAVTTAISFDVRDKQSCDRHNGVYSRGVCFKRDILQEY